MGFIERLRQQFETEKLAQQQREDDFEAARKAERLALEQKTTQEQAIREQRKRQVKAFREESGIGVLVVELGKVLAEQHITMPPYHQYRFPEVISKGFSMGPDYSITKPYSNNSVFPTNYPIGYSSRVIHIREHPSLDVYPDVEDIGDCAIEADNDNRTKPQLKRRMPIEDACSTLDVAIWDREHEDASVAKGVTLQAKQKFLAVETCPNGNIIFHAWEKTLIPLGEWRANKGILDKALEKAFDRPGIHRFMRYMPQEPGE